MDALDGWLGPMNFLQGRIFFSGQHLRHPKPRRDFCQPMTASPQSFLHHARIHSPGPPETALKRKDFEDISRQFALRFFQSMPEGRLPKCRGAICVQERKRDLFRE
jgi:hypothetical protein